MKQTQWRFHIFTYDAQDRIMGQYSTDYWPMVQQRLKRLKVTLPANRILRVKDINLKPLGKHQRV